MATEDDETLKQAAPSMIPSRIPLPSYFPLDNDNDVEGEKSNEKTNDQETPNSILTQEDVAGTFQGRRSLEFDPKLNDILDGDDDDSILSTSSEESMSSLTMLQKRKRNQQRNAQRYRDLFGDLFGDQLGAMNDSANGKSSSQDEEGESDENDLPLDTKPRGMLRKKVGSFPTAETGTKGIKERMTQLLEIYPDRETQVRRLTSLFRATIGQVAGKQGIAKGSLYVPPPIFVVGARGTGKTSVARASLDAASQTQKDATASSSCVGTAYVNCATLEPSTIGRLVTSVYNQLQPNEYRDLKRRRRRQKRRRKKKKKAKLKEAQLESSSSQQENAPDNIPMDEDTEELQGKLMLDERRVQPTRAVKKISDEPAPFNTRKGKESKEDEASTLEHSVETTHSVVVSLGRSLQPFYGVESKRCAFVILDQAPERLLTLSASNNKHEKTNLLSELLMLPKVMKLNVTFVVITTNVFLHTSRLNSLVEIDKSLATISSGLHPVIVQFPAYKGKESFLKILKSKQVLDQIIGEYPVESRTENPFFNKVLHTFLASLVQFVSDSTRDLKNLIRIGRFLWPLYIAPVHPDNIEVTMNSIRGAGRALPPNQNTSADAESKILGYLGQKLLSHTTALSGDEVTGVLIDSSSAGKFRVPRPQCDIHLPYLQSCLLLACFICQNNRSDQDKKVFVAEANGRTRKRGHDTMHKGDDEHVAYSASINALKQLHSLRPRPFQAERVFSIFVTLVRLNPSKIGGVFEEFDEDKLQNLGSSHLHKDMAELIDFGYLHPTKFNGSVRNEQINFNGAKFWCSLTREEALRIAKRFAIPLDNYLV